MRAQAVLSVVKKVCLVFLQEISTLGQMQFMEALYAIVW
jgi:hypothetical protein